MTRPRKAARRKPARKTGRPSKLTPDVVRVLCKALAEGLYIDQAAAIAGVSRSSVYAWMERGEKCKAGLFREFLDALQKAEAEAEKKAVARIRRAADRGVWQASAWFLERRHPARWARRNMIGFEDSTRQIERLRNTVRELGGDKLVDAFERAVDQVADAEARVKPSTPPDSTPDPGTGAEPQRPQLRAVEGGKESS